jgi:hypothetical protein
LDWVGLVLLSLTAPLIAACIQSVFVVFSDHWIYQAVIGGAYFLDVEKPGASTILFILGSCGALAIPTFLILRPFRQRVLYRWLIWIGFVALWTWCYFATEICIK